MEAHKESKKPQFSLSPSDDKKAEDNYCQQPTDTQSATNGCRNDDGDQAIIDGDENVNDGASSPQTIPNVKDQDRLSGSDLSFTKRDIRKSRTQSFQSVLSAASLKMVGSTIPRNSSQVSNSSKNFQSFIQAPALSSINPKNDDVQIGVHAPFNDRLAGIVNKSTENFNRSSDNVSRAESKNNDNTTDKHNIVKKDVITHKETGSDEDPSNLTLDALKKLSKSPLPINNEPYKPAKVDLTSFASLTRQSKSSHNLKISPEEPVTPQIQSQSVQNNYKLRMNLNNKANADTNPESSNGRPNYSANLNSQPVLNNLTEQIELLILSSQQQILQGSNYQQFPSHLQNPQPQQKPKVPAAVTPPSNMIRRESNQSLNNVVPQDPSTNVPTTGFNKPTKQLHQIKELRNPMYTPAVLRVTQSMHDGESPFDHLQKSMTSSSQNSISSMDSNQSQESNTKITPGSLGSRNYDEVLRAPPTRRHWVKDESVLKCSIVTCPKVFNFFERRHHCRKCGRIYCKEHTSHYLYINHLAQFTTGGRGTLCKVCDLCIEDYNKFIKNEFGISSTTKPVPQPAVVGAESQVSKTKKMEFKPVNKKLNLSSTQRTGPSESHERGNDQLVGSVPANWSWSSF